jgi:hypothetical protein
VRTLAGLTAVVLLSLPAGCGDDGALEGECGPKVRHDGTVYRALATHSTPPRGKSLGPGRYGDCSGDLVPGDGPDLYSVPGVDPADAVLAGEYTDTVYVAQELSRSRAA